MEDLPLCLQCHVSLPGKAPIVITSAVVDINKGKLCGGMVS